MSNRILQYPPAPGKPFGLTLTERRARVRVVEAAADARIRPEDGSRRVALTQQDARVFKCLALDFHNSKTGLCCPSVRTVADRLTLHHATVARSVRRLEAFGVLVIEERVRPHRFVRGAVSWSYRFPAIELATDDEARGESEACGVRASQAQPQPVEVKKKAVGDKCSGGGGEGAPVRLTDTAAIPVLTARWRQRDRIKRAAMAIGRARTRPDLPPEREWMPGGVLRRAFLASMGEADDPAAARAALAARRLAQEGARAWART